MNQTSRIEAILQERAQNVELSYHLVWCLNWKREDSTAECPNGAERPSFAGQYSPSDIHTAAKLRHTVARTCSVPCHVPKQKKGRKMVKRWDRLGLILVWMKDGFELIYPSLKILQESHGNL